MEAGFKEEVAFEPGRERGAGERGAGMSPALGGKQQRGVGVVGKCRKSLGCAYWKVLVWCPVSQHGEGIQVKCESGSGWIWRAWALPRQQATGLDWASGQWGAGGRALGRKRLADVLGNHLSVKQAFTRVCNAPAPGQAGEGAGRTVMQGQRPGVPATPG